MVFLAVYGGWFSFLATSAENKTCFHVFFTSIKLQCSCSSACSCNFSGMIILPHFPLFINAGSSPNVWYRQMSCGTLYLFSYHPFMPYSFSCFRSTSFCVASWWSKIDMHAGMFYHNVHSINANSHVWYLYVLVLFVILSG